MALRLAEALNWRGIPSCGLLRRAGKPFICSSEGQFKGKKAFECDRCSWKRSESIKRVYFGVPACLPGACFVAFTSAAPAASEQLVIPLPSTNIVPHRFRNKSSRESRPVFERANPSVHHAADHQSDLLFSVRVWVLLGRTLTWIFQAYFLSSLLLFTRSEWWVTEPTFECRNQKKNKDPLGNNCKEITEALCKAESAL